MTGDLQKLGKSVGKDARQKKLTYPMVFGVERSRELAAEAVGRAVAALQPLGERAAILQTLAQFLLERQA